jgi:hypothetical protein
MIEFETTRLARAWAFFELLQKIKSTPAQRAAELTVWIVNKIMPVLLTVPGRDAFAMALLAHVPKVQGYIDTLMRTPDNKVNGLIGQLNFLVGEAERTWGLKTSIDKQERRSE